MTLAARLSSAHPLVIDQATFTLNGGDVLDVANSIKTHNDVLRAYSYNTPWLAVGSIGTCTATWLGDQDSWSYVLTAAHCVDYTAEATSVDRTFTAWDGRVVASGPGTAYVPPERIYTPSGMGGASTDIAVLKLPTRAPIISATGRPLERPILNDALDEIGRDVVFVGYGAWGVGAEQSGSFAPATGARRLYARARIDSIFEKDHGIGARYQGVGPSASWGRVAPGDSGSAWWQLRDGRAVIIATTNGGHATLSTGARVAKYIAWLRGVYAEVRLASAEPPQGCIVSLRTNDSYCLAPGQQAASSTPAWIYAHAVRVDAAPGTAVELSDGDGLARGRVARLVGSVENEALRAVEADSGERLDVSRPRSMRVVASTAALGCVTALATGSRYCRPPGGGGSLPGWISGVEVQVEAMPGAAVTLSDEEGLTENGTATFDGFVQNWELKRARTVDGAVLDVSRPKSMRVS